MSTDDSTGLTGTPPPGSAPCLTGAWSGCPPLDPCLLCVSVSNGTGASLPSCRIVCGFVRASSGTETALSFLGPAGSKRGQSLLNWWVGINEQRSVCTFEKRHGAGQLCPPKSSSSDAGRLTQSCQRPSDQAGLDPTLPEESQHALRDHSLPPTPSPSLFGEAASGRGLVAFGKAWAWPLYWLQFPGAGLSSQQSWWAPT